MDGEDSNRALAVEVNLPTILIQMEPIHYELISLVGEPGSSGHNARVAIMLDPLYGFRDFRVQIRETLP